MSRAPSTGGGDLHRAWLELVDTDGPFLAVPELKRVWPSGMPALRDDALAALREARPAFENAWEKWDLDPADAAALAGYRSARDTWVATVLREVVGWGEAYRPAPPGAVAVRSPDHVVSVAATGGLVHAGATAALVLVVDPVENLRSPLDDGWAAAPVDRLEELLRASGVPVGVVTDGRWWALVDAQPEVLVASGIVDALTWTEEPAARNALVELLGRRRLVGGRPDDRLPALFARSVAAAEEITEALGVQVRRAVELLVAALSEAGVDAQRHGRPDPLPADRTMVYEAAVTVLMRVVFLLFAQERGVLPQSALFDRGYGIAGDLDALDRRFRNEDAEGLDSTALTWHRLLATSRALHRGASFDDLRLPAYGGSLFDPDRFPFLTARTDLGTLAVAVSDRVMLEVLRAVQVARLRGEPARRISFRDVDVEQIGYIYEGLLGYSCARVSEVTVGLIGRPGAEPEITLDELESLADTHPDPSALAGAILASVAASQPAAVPRSRAELVRQLRAADQIADAERALRAVTSAPGLRDRLRPFLGIIRRDLRHRPTVFEPGGVLVVETPSRATAGAHYTPRRLAEEVVRHALEPLVYDPGPRERADGWTLVSPERILALRVVDIACGSGAFLVAAARYLAGKLVEAWHQEGTAVGSPDELGRRAVRKVVASCLYGADINGMAVEMAKLSLWLVSLDARLPFSFVDDKVLHGNSLLGLTDRRQVAAVHVDPSRAGTAMSLYDLDIDGILNRAIALRDDLADEVDNRDPQRSATAKRRKWARYQELVGRLTDVADAVVAQGLRHGGRPGRNLDEAYEDLRVAVETAFSPDGPQQRDGLDAILAEGLTPTVVTDHPRWLPLHWALQVPDVLQQQGGFDAVIGNPPFLGGQKLTGTQGTNVRGWYVHTLAGGRRGSADLVAYFFLRAYALLKPAGTLGLIATNTLAQGDTREVGLDRLEAAGFTITRAVQSASWPVASANLEYAAVWGTRGPVAPDVPRVADGVAVARISTLLEPTGRVTGSPRRLAENLGVAFQGCVVLGVGFVVEPAEAQAWIAADPAHADVLFPYLNGEDANSRSDASAPRWVIDFNDRSEEAAAAFRLPYERVVEQVKPERLRNNRRARRERWWQFAERAAGLRAAVADLDEVLVIALVSKTVMPVRVPTRQVFSHKLGVFATDSFADQAVLSSSQHWSWALKYSSTLESRVNYSPSDVFVTFPRPAPTDRLVAAGRTLDTERREIMLRRDLGLTRLYNLVNDPDVTADRDAARLREVHVELDDAVLAAYGWADLALDHGFHVYRQMRRWTVRPKARVEVLDRLLQENHRRARTRGAREQAEA